MKSKAEELLESTEDIFEMSNMATDQTGLSYYIHIRTKLETPSHPNTPTLKVYEGRPYRSDSFSMVISDDPKTLHPESKFYKKVPQKELAKIVLWISTNKEKLLDFYNNGMSWTTPETDSWERTLTKV